MSLGSGFQTRPTTARQMPKHALHLFLHMRGDAALRGRVDGEDTSICTALDVPEHPTSAFTDGSPEGFRFPTVQKRGIEAVPGRVAVGEHERLFGVQSVLCEGVEFCGVPVNLDLDLGKGHGIYRICTLSVDCEGNVGLVVIGIRILSVPTAWERNLRPESTRTPESWESIMTRGLNQRVETKESFV